MGKRRGMHPLIKAGIVAGALLLLVVALIAVWAVGVMQRQPTVKVDYVAKLNERARAVPPEERAWPVYARAHAALVPMEAIDPERRFAFADPDEEGWDKLVAWVEANEKTLEILEEARDKEGMGFVVDLDAATLGPIDLIMETGHIISEADMLRHLRTLARLHRASAVFAASRGDAEAAVNHVSAIYEMSGRANEHGLMINGLVAVAIAAVGDALVAELIYRNSDLFSPTQLSDIRLKVKESRGAARRMRIAGERYGLLDMIQRSYTDDGAGAGKFAPRPWLDSLTQGRVQASPIGPVSAVFVLNRAEVTATVDQVFDAVEQRMSQDPWTWEGPMDLGPRMEEIEDASPLRFMRFMLGVTMGAYDRFVAAHARIRMSEGFTELILAAAQHRARHGAWPESMEAIDGDLLEGPTLDMFTGEPVKYELRDGRPFIYSVGMDLDDDGGRHVDGARVWRPAERRAELLSAEPGEHDGDWVFFPPPETD